MLRRPISHHIFLHCNHIAIANILPQWELGGFNLMLLLSNGEPVGHLSPIADMQ